MRLRRVSVSALVVVLALAAGACGSDDSDDSGSSDSSETTAAVDSGSDDTTVDTEADDTDPAELGNLGTISVTLSTGDVYDVPVTECSLDGANGEITGEGFSLSYTDYTGPMTLEYPGGTIETEAGGIVAAGDLVTVTGTTDDGIGYNLSISCA